MQSPPVTKHRPNRSRTCRVDQPPRMRATAGIGAGRPSGRTPSRRLDRCSNLPCNHVETVVAVDPKVILQRHQLGRQEFRRALANRSRCGPSIHIFTWRLRVAFFEGEQENAGGGHPSSRAKNRTFTPRNSHRIPDPQFVHVFGTTVRCFAPLFPVFDGPAPLTPAIRGRRAVQIASEVE